MLEFEKKILLTKHEYYMLKENRYHSDKTFLQINYYYDTDDYQFNRAGITCRIREKNGICIATVKRHEKSRSVENSFFLKDKWDNLFFKNMGIYYQGSLTTKRTVFTLCPGIKVMLDENNYLAITDYELEIEYDPCMEKTVMSEINSIIFWLSFHRGTSNKNLINHFESKSRRFFQRKNALKKYGGG